MCEIDLRLFLLDMFALPFLLVAMRCVMIIGFVADMHGISYSHFLRFY